MHVFSSIGCRLVTPLRSFGEEGHFDISQILILFKHYILFILKLFIDCSYATDFI
jgi:hypothetical protein